MHISAIKRLKEKKVCSGRRVRTPLLDVPLELRQPADSDVQRIVGLPHHRPPCFFLALVTTCPIRRSRRQELLLVIDQIASFRLGRCVHPALRRTEGSYAPGKPRERRQTEQNVKSVCTLTWRPAETTFLSRASTCWSIPMSTFMACSSVHQHSIVSMLTSCSWTSCSRSEKIWKEKTFYREKKTHEKNLEKLEGFEN